MAEAWQRSAASCGWNEDIDPKREVETMTHRTSQQERRTEAAARAPHSGGLTLSLWLLATLVAEIELLLWLVERAYAA